MKTRTLASGAMIAALYAVLTVAVAPLSYGPVQFRVAEALTLLPLYLPEADRARRLRRWAGARGLPG